jgi:hypothetical protein
LVLLAVYHHLVRGEEAKARRAAAPPDSITLHVIYQWGGMAVDSSGAYEKVGKWDSLTWRARARDLLAGSKNAGAQFRLGRILARDSAWIAFPSGVLEGPGIVRSKRYDLEFEWDSVIVSSSAIRLVQGAGSDLWSELMVRIIPR